MRSHTLASANQHHIARSPQRIQLRVFRGASWRFVYVETTASGELAFWDEEPGDVRRYPFTPSPPERQALLQALQTGAERGCTYIDLDVPQGSLDAAADVSLAAFRHFVREHAALPDIIALERRMLAFLQHAGNNHTAQPTTRHDDNQADPTPLIEKAA